MKLLCAVSLLVLPLPFLAAARRAILESSPRLPPASSAAKPEEADSTRVSIPILEQSDGFPGGQNSSRLAAAQLLALFEGVRIPRAGGWKHKLSTQGLTLEGTRELSPGIRVLTFRAPRRTPDQSAPGAMRSETVLNFEIDTYYSAKSRSSVEMHILRDSGNWAQKVLEELDKEAGTLQIRSMKLEGDGPDALLKVRLVLTPD